MIKSKNFKLKGNIKREGKGQATTAKELKVIDYEQTKLICKIAT